MSSRHNLESYRFSPPPLRLLDSKTRKNRLFVRSNYDLHRRMQSTHCSVSRHETHKLSWKRSLYDWVFRVELSSQRQEVWSQRRSWLEFWSGGNHRSIGYGWVAWRNPIFEVRQNFQEQLRYAFRSDQKVDPGAQALRQFRCGLRSNRKNPQQMITTYYLLQTHY